MGTHIIFDLYGVPFHKLNDREAILDAFDRAVLAMGATVLNKFSHQFSPQGVTVLYALAESHMTFHASAHSFPELGSAALDCYTCGTMDTQAGVDVLINYFNPIETKITKLLR